jgi:hypothetical protein
LPAKTKRPSKVAQLLETIRKHVSGDSYLDTRHATDRKHQRHILRSEIRSVLLAGFHERSRDRYDELNKRWSYVVRGHTVDRRELRVVVAFNAAGLLIITAIELTGKGVHDGDQDS